MRCRHGLVQIEVHDINTQIAGARNAHEGIQIGAIAVNIATAIVDESGNGRLFRLEDAQSVGVGNHEARAIIVHEFFDLRKHHAAIVADIEDDLMKRSLDEVETGLIGEMVMERLKSRDHVAYVRFASVYRNFQDIDEFYDELRELSARRARAAQSEGQAELPF